MCAVSAQGAEAVEHFGGGLMVWDHMGALAWVVLMRHC